MRSIQVAVLAAIASATVATAASAQDASSRWIVHAGPAYVDPDESALMTAGGAALPGANVSIKGRWTVEGELTYLVTPHIGVAVAAGAPPTFDIMTAGTLAGMGKAGEMTGGPAGLLLQYHFNPEGKFQPYVGAGASFLVVFDTKDGVLTNVKAKSAVGTALQVGANLMFTDRVGGFVDVKKAFVDTTATGFLGPAPVRAKVQVDPLVYNAGVAWRF